MKPQLTIALSDIVRLPVGTTETYMMYQGELSYFLKKLSTYALRVNAKIKHRIATVVWDDSDTVVRMVVVKVVKSGVKAKPRGKKKHAEK